MGRLNLLETIYRRVRGNLNADIPKRVAGARSEQMFTAFHYSSRDNIPQQVWCFEKWFRNTFIYFK